MTRPTTADPAPHLVDLLIHSAAEVLTCRANPGDASDRAGRATGPIRDGAVAVDAGVIVAVGDTADVRARFRGRCELDAAGRLVSPGLVDTHTHLVHAGTRHQEWGRLVTGTGSAGLGAGIAYTRELTAAASEAELRAGVVERLDTMLAHGTTTVEAKSGYGIDPADDVRLLRVLADVDHPVDLVTTYLGAHVAPTTGPRAEFVDAVIAQLDSVVDLADYCDLCCDPVGFTPAECRRIGVAALDRGLGLRVHADQTACWHGTELAVELGAASVDHLECASDRAIQMLGRSSTAATLLPGVSHHLMSMVGGPADGSWRDAPHPDLGRRARRLVDAGALVVLASDYNPGSSPNLSMQTTMQLAARLYRLAYGEIWRMSTINAAVSLGRGDRIGSIEPGKQADLVIWNVPSHELVVNQFGTNLVRTVVKAGTVACGPSLGLAPRTRRGEEVRSGR